MKVIKLALLAILFTSTSYASYAPNVDVFLQEKDLLKPVVVEYKLSSEYGTKYSYEDILEVVIPVAEKYNVSYERMMYTIEAESHLMNIQSGCHRNEYTNCGKEGVREESYGISQFHISTLSKEEALNPYIAIEKMGYYFSIGEACRWTEYKKRYGCN